MSEPDNSQKDTVRIALPPQHPGVLPKTELTDISHSVEVSLAAERQGDKMTDATSTAGVAPDLARSSLPHLSYKPMAAPNLPPPGILPVAGIPSSTLGSLPMNRAESEAQKIKKSHSEERSSIPQMLINLSRPTLEPFSMRNDQEETMPRDILPIAIYLTLGASLVALGIQVWILLDTNTLG